jgi:hypothetical protein
MSPRNLTIFPFYFHILFELNLITSVPHPAARIFSRQKILRPLRSGRGGAFASIPNYAHVTRIKNRNAMFRFLIIDCFYADTTRFLFFISVPGTLVLRASCFTIRVCLRTPLDSRLSLVLISVVSNCVAPCVVILYFCDWLRTLTRACQFHLWLSDGYIHI